MLLTRTNLLSREDLWLGMIWRRGENGDRSQVRWMEEVVYRDLGARVGWERVCGKKFWAEVAEGSARGEFRWLIPPIQESRNLCLHVQDQHYTQESFCSKLQ